MNAMQLEVEKISSEKEVRQKRGLIIFFVLAMCVQGVLVAYASELPKLVWFADRMPAILIVAVSLVWCLVDARAKGSTLSFGWTFGLFLLAPVFFPAYVIKERGFKSGAVLVAKAIGLLLFAALLSVVSENITGFLLSKHV